MPIIDPDRDPGLDQGLTPYQRAQSWLYMMWMDVYHKCMAMIEQEILDAGGSLGGGKHGIAMGFSGTVSVSLTVLPPAPVNVFGKSLFVKSIAIYGDDAVGATFSFGGPYSTGDGSVTTTDVSPAWEWVADAQLTWELDSVGESLSSFGWTIEAE